MEEFAAGWCRHHFSFYDTNSDVSVPAYSAQGAYVAPPGWPTTDTSLHPALHPARNLPTHPPTSSQTAAPPPSDSSNSEDPDPLPDTDSEPASPPDPGPVDEPPADGEGRAGYLRLLLATEFHRRELRRRRRAEQAPPPLELSADTERLRQQQMRRLYGAAADRVAAAESRAQLEFDTISDQHRPPLWPNIPLKIRFA